jgi:hypothetical protein
MNKISVLLLVGAGALYASTAQAAPLTNGTPAINNGMQNVRMVCNENGRCWRERRGERTVIIQRNRHSYNYAPRERYIERRHYGHGHGHGPGVGIRAPGVSIGIGADSHRW